MGNLRHRGVVSGIFRFNKNMPLTIRSAFFPLLKDRIWGWPGHIIDVLAVVATIFGLATSLGGFWCPAGRFGGA